MTISAAQKTKFVNFLLDWNRRINDRPMPWKGEKDPYRIWLSEIILQQTRVEQGLDYYNRFIKTYPDIHSLASAEDNQVFKLWEGLGYYSRCRNLLQTARYISSELNGKFPKTFEEIVKLKGVGPYTAAAIASFAFNLPHAVVDGNVYRVLSRAFGVSTPMDSTTGKKEFSSLANEILSKTEPGVYNQAIMDFGATVCKPSPDCSVCGFRKNCVAFKNDLVDQLPVKTKKVTIKKRWFYYMIMEHEGYIAIRQRVGKDIWNQLFEYPMLEASQELQEQDVIALAKDKGFLTQEYFNSMGISLVHKQQLSHQLIHGRFLRIILKKKPKNSNDWKWIPATGLKEYAFPKIITTYHSESQTSNP